MMAKETISVRLDRETWDRLAIQDAVDELEQGTADLADHKDVAEWLNSWGTGNEAKPSACK